MEWGNMERPPRLWLRLENTEARLQHVVGLHEIDYIPMGDEQCQIG